jgi:TatD DNase family protein
MLTDTHCHLYSLEHKTPDEAVQDAVRAGVGRMICIGAGHGLESADKAIALSEKHAEVYAVVGVHPHDAKERVSVKQLAQYFDHPKVVAIGETGLDFFRDWSPFDEQRRVFIETIGIARELNKPLIIHCRDAEDEVVKLLKQERASEVGGVFHCYGGTAEFANRINEFNFIVSVTGMITFKKNDQLRSEISKIPLDQIILETDCPYMAPEPFRGKPSEPAHVVQIADCLAKIKGIPTEEIAQETEATIGRVFGLKK